MNAKQFVQELNKKYDLRIDIEGNTLYMPTFTTKADDLASLQKLSKDELEKLSSYGMSSYFREMFNEVFFHSSEKHPDCRILTDMSDKLASKIKDIKFFSVHDNSHDDEARIDAIFSDLDRAIEYAKAKIREDDCYGDESIRIEYQNDYSNPGDCVVEVDTHSRCIIFIKGQDIDVIENSPNPNCVKDEKLGKENTKVLTEVEVIETMKHEALSYLFKEQIKKGYVNISITYNPSTEEVQVLGCLSKEMKDKRDALKNIRELMKATGLSLEDIK